MDRIIKEFKKQKYTTICIVIFIILLIVAYLIYNMIFGGRGTPIMGNRLDGIEEVVVQDDTWNNILNNLKDNENVVDAKKVTENEGSEDRILNIIVVMKDGVKNSEAKKLTTLVTDELSESQLAYFDIETYFTNENTESSGYPMIAYKNKNSDSFSYSNRK